MKPPWGPIEDQAKVYNVSTNPCILNLFIENYTLSNIIILCFITTVISQEIHEIEILVNIVHMYSLDGRPIIGELH